ncbi:MAG: dephospho-CoA kinase [Candidatus Omnitrophota bacterium]
MSTFALTGHWASGKSAVLGLLRKKGAVIFDADKSVHAYYRDQSSTVYKRIVAAFPGVSGRKGISRKKLGAAVFSDFEKLTQLERIVHPVVIRDLKHWVRDAQSRQAIHIAEVPLLFEKGLGRYFDAVIVVSAKEKIIRRRLRAKTGLSDLLMTRRLSLYMPMAKKIRMADFVLDNNSGLRALQRKVNVLWEQLRQY